MQAWAFISEDLLWQLSKGLLVTEFDLKNNKAWLMSEKLPAVLYVGYFGCNRVPLSVVEKYVHSRPLSEKSVHNDDY